MKKVANYDIRGMRIRLIELLTENLNKDSKWYKIDYENIVKAVNSKSMFELVESLERWDAVVSIKQETINKHCIFKNKQ